jgi:hypothetical protein
VEGSCRKGREVNGKNGGAQPLFLHASFEDKGNKKKISKKKLHEKTDSMLRFHNRNEGLARTQGMKKAEILEWKWKNVIITFNPFQLQARFGGLL